MKTIVLSQGIAPYLMFDRYEIEAERGRSTVCSIDRSVVSLHFSCSDDKMS